MQQDLFAFENHRDDDQARLPMPDARVSYYPDFLPADQADHYFAVLQQTLAWRQERIVLYGNSHLVPRLQAWYGEPEASYHYSDLSLVPLPWTTELQELRQLCEQHCSGQFNSVLANLYRNGNDSMGMHSDDEAELGPRPIIASLTLGEERALIFSHKRTRQRFKLPLRHGSLLVMAGTTQHFWRHGMAKQLSVVQPRVNLTFRRIYPK